MFPRLKPTVTLLTPWSDKISVPKVMRGRSGQGDMLGRSIVISCRLSLNVLLSSEMATFSLMPRVVQ